MEKMMDNKIVVNHLVKKFGDNTVLNDLNITISEGEGLHHRTIWFWEKYVLTLYEPLRRTYFR